MVIDLTEAADRVRLAVADTSDIPFLPTEVYEYLLTKYSNNEAAATKEAAYLILGQLSMKTRQRLDRLEFFGNQTFEQYVKFIGEVIKNPNGYLNLAGIYGGGISKTDVEANLSDSDTIHRHIPAYTDVEFVPPTASSTF